MIVLKYTNIDINDSITYALSDGSHLIKCFNVSTDMINCTVTVTGIDTRSSAIAE